MGARAGGPAGEPAGAGSGPGPGGGDGRPDGIRQRRIEPLAGHRGAPGHRRPHPPRRARRGHAMTRHPGRSRAVDTAWYAFTALYCAFVLGWLLLGLAAALTKHVPGVHHWAVTVAQGQSWPSLGAGLLAGAKESYPPVDVWLDYIFSAVNLLFAAILFRLARRDWTV